MDTQNSGLAGEPLPNTPTAAPLAYRAKLKPSAGLFVGALLAAILSALACWGAGEKGLLKVKPAERTVPMMSGSVTGATAETRNAAKHQEAALTYGILGALTTATIGLVVGRLFGGRSAILSLLGGLVVGGVLGGGAAAILAPVILNYQDLTGSMELFLPLFVHGGIFGAIGAAVGLVASFGTKDRRQILASVLGGALGAIAGGVVYDIIGAIAFPMDETAQPISATTITRLLAFTLTSIGAAVGTVLSFPKAPKTTPTVIVAEA
ncbi:hypothetical protein [Singulisphaera sp. PoT]|uniref:hypothetical protein n=1 Tax=Singulisphaera sp. PoT TaxID=3411797 RepID=UPI003BF53230